MSDEHPGQQQSSEPQWIPVAPPRPYADGQPAPQRSKSTLLAIFTMAIGLVALLTTVVSAAYFSPVVGVAGGALGVAAIALGVIAIVKNFRPTGAAITGLVSGALSIATATALIGAGALVAQIEDSSPPQGSESWGPGAPQESLLDWPANMGSGGIVFEGPGDPRPRAAEPLQPGTAPEPNRVDRESSNDILIYADYRCPHCMDFEQTNGEYLAGLVASGDTTVEVVPLSFMDRVSEGSYYSSRAVGAIACLVDSQPAGAWNAHATLLSSEVQPGVGTGLDNEELIAALERGVGNLDPAVRDCIETERFVPFAQALNEWVFQNPIPNTSVDSVRLESTPTILVNGLVYPGDPSDAEAFRAFVEEQAN